MASLQNEFIDERDVEQRKRAEQDAITISQAKYSHSLFNILKLEDSLAPILSGINPNSINVDHLRLMQRWSKPLVGGGFDPQTNYARQILDIDGIESQGLLKNCTDYKTKNMISVIETYFKLSRTMDKNEYIALLKSSVYSQSKALILVQKIEHLGQQWFALKDELKRLQLKNIPQP